MAGLPRIFDVCTPKAEVCSGELSDAIFAARLNDVDRGIAHPAYQLPEEFFAQTYATERMKSLFRQVAERLRGVGGAPAYVRLDTPFGGGKSHTLIALWHVATSGRGLSDNVLHSIGLKREELPGEAVKVVAIVGTDLDPTNSLEQPDGTKVYHLWGMLAHRLGGRHGYDLVAESDRIGLAPAADFLDRIVGDSPVLILIDELANYLRRMPEASKAQLPAFFHNLTEWAASPGTRRALVVTFAEDAFQNEAREIQEALATVFSEVKRLSARSETVVTPAERHDYAHILRRRLFDRVDASAAELTANAYAALYRQVHHEDFRLPEATQRGDFVRVLQDHYPFHPTLIDLLDGKLALIPSFQKTRGALRLLARTIRRLWDTQPADANFILPCHIDLSAEAILDELTGRLDRPRHREVAHIDIWREDGQAHAQLIDRQYFGEELSYAQRVATVIFLHSLPEAAAQGVHPADIRLSVLSEAAKPSFINKALQELSGHTEVACWHLDRRRDGESAEYFFTLEPNLNRIIVEEMQQIGQSEVRQELERRIRTLWREAVGFGVDHFQGDPSQIKDEARARLVLLHWDTATFDGQSVPTKVREMRDWQPGGGYRRFQNALVFLVAAKDRTGPMLNSARRYLAIDRINRRADQYRISPEKKKQELEPLLAAQESAVTLAICRAYNVVLYSSDASESAFRPFAYLTLSVEDQGRMAPNMTEVVISALRDAEKLKRGDDPPLGAPFVVQSAFNHDEKSITAEALWQRFFERSRLPLLLTPDYLRSVIVAGVRGGHWLLYDPAKGCAHGPTTLVPARVEISSSQEVVLVEEAKRRSIKLCGEPAPAPQTAVQEPSPQPLVQPPPRPLVIDHVEAEDEPGKAFGDLAARARDAGWSAAGRLRVSWDGMGAELSDRLIALRSVLAQASPIVDATSVTLDVESQATEGASWSARFSGSGGFYQQRVAASLEAVMRHFTDGHIGVDLELVFSGGLAIGGADWDDLREAFRQAGLGASKWILQRMSEDSER